ncbi:uncharacterized protein LOC111592221 [Drosophila hydei]|uniref:Uncharacterized protein LOC111592221 n=1 Tax=Drosophila hydei TaxID=7224 RepID=A0A6J1L167_DROHY|nr:uncharacterized protein LOC111592221 [Drosophila hydei]
MKIQTRIRLVLSFLLCSSSCPVHCDIGNVGHYSQTLVNSFLDLYTDNNDSISSSSSRPSETMAPDNSKANFEPIVPTHIYPYLLLSLWVTCITCIVCCCLYCKCQQADSLTAYNLNSFELQEVHVVDHPLPHVKGCVCLGCLQRQVAKELQQKRSQ